MLHHQGTKVLETERLILRQLVVEDAEKCFSNWMSDPEVTKYLTWQTHKNIEETKSILKYWCSKYEDNDFYQWVIVLKENNEPIGTISVVSTNENIDAAEIGYCIGKRWWRQGYTSEALSRVIAFLFEEVKANSVYASHDIENPNSGKVMRKCGMKYEGTLRQSKRNNRGIVDACMHSILAEEYFKKQLGICI